MKAQFYKTLIHGSQRSENRDTKYNRWNTI
jgi:hypothetical protein